MMIAILLMAKNEMGILPQTFPSLVQTGWPILVLDTGSTDETAQYVSAQGAEVFQYEEWDGNFAKARNTLLSAAKTPWVLFLDADEYLEPSDLAKLGELVQETQETFFKLPIYQNVPGEKNRAGSMNYRIKLYRTDCGYHYCRPLNEDLVGYDVEKALDDAIFLKKIPIYHWGNYESVDPDRFVKKEENYIRMYTQVLTDPVYQKDAYLNMQCASHFANLKRFREAMPYFVNSVRYSLDDTIRRYHYFALLFNLVNLKNWSRFDRIIGALEKRFGVLNKELYYVKGKAAIDQGQLDDAKNAFEACLSAQDPEGWQQFYYDTAVREFFPRLYLGLINEKNGQIQTAVTLLNEATKYGQSPILDKALARLGGKPNA